MWGVEGIGEIRPGDVLADHIVDAIAAMAAADAAVALRDGDVLVVTQKIVSKAEGRVVAIDPDDPLSHKHLVEEEAVRIVRRRGTSSSPRRGTASCARTPASTCRTWSGAGPRCCPSTPIDRPAASATVCGPERLHRRRHRVRHVRTSVAQGAHRRGHRVRGDRGRVRPAGHPRRARAGACRSPRCAWPTSSPARRRW